MRVKDHGVGDNRTMDHGCFEIRKSIWLKLIGHGKGDVLRTRDHHSQQTQLEGVIRSRRDPRSANSSKWEAAGLQATYGVGSHEVDSLKAL